MNTSSSSRNRSGTPAPLTIAQRCRQAFEALGFHCQVVDYCSVFGDDEFSQIVKAASGVNEAARVLCFMPDLFVMHPRMPHEHGVFFARVLQGRSHFAPEELSTYAKYYPERILVLAATDGIPSILHAQWLRKVIAADQESAPIQPSALPRLRQILTIDLGLKLPPDYPRRIQELKIEI